MRRSPLRPEYEPGVLGNARLHGRKPEGVYIPPVKDVWQRYLRKFTKNGKLLDEEGLGLADAPALAPAPASAPAPAPAPAPASP